MCSGWAMSGSWMIIRLIPEVEEAGGKRRGMSSLRIFKEDDIGKMARTVLMALPTTNYPNMSKSVVKTPLSVVIGG